MLYPVPVLTNLPTSYLPSAHCSHPAPSYLTPTSLLPHSYLYPPPRPLSAPSAPRAMGPYSNHEVRGPTSTRS